MLKYCFFSLWQSIWQKKRNFNKLLRFIYFFKQMIYNVIVEKIRFFDNLI